jgi:hypothetical protein
MIAIGVSVVRLERRQAFKTMAKDLVEHEEVRGRSSLTGG